MRKEERTTEPSDEIANQVTKFERSEGWQENLQAQWGFKLKSGNEDDQQM